MGFNLRFAEPNRRSARGRARRPLRIIWLLSLGLCLAAGIVVGQQAVQAIVYGR
jgi:hypothetical protein